MTDNVPYYQNKIKFCWKPEAGGYRICHGAGSIDETNLNTDTFFRFPGRIVGTPFEYIKKNGVWQRIAGYGSYYGYVAHEGMEEGMLDISFEMNDLSIMYYAYKGCTTQDDTPSAGKYTHTYINTTTRVTPPPSFGILWAITNVDSDNNLTYLYTGCVIQSYKVTGGIENNKITLTLKIHYSNCVAGTALTTPGYPTSGTLRTHLFSKTSISYKKATTSYPCYIHAFTINYNDGTFLHKGANEENAGIAFNGNQDIEVDLSILPLSRDLVDDLLITPLEPGTANDIDVIIKCYRDTTTDYVEWTFEKLWNPKKPPIVFDYEREGTTLGRIHPKFILKPPSFETGAKLTTVEINALDDDRYET